MEMRLVAFDVREELAEVERLMAPLITARQQTLSISVAPETPLAYADRARFRQVVLNVLSNANKFTPDGGSITVACDWIAVGGAENTERRNEEPFSSSASLPLPPSPHVRVRVTDTGIGIRPEDAHKVFEEFRQIDGSLSRQYGGTGLGLALSKRLIEMQGGTISFESTPSVGTTFTVTVPGTVTGSIG
jgi:signal transduction histidine kinase